MTIADLQMPSRLLAGGGPCSPDPRVLHALTTPLIGQFDPQFTAIMDDVVQLARQTFLTNNLRTFAVSGLASAGIEAVLNTLLEKADCIAVQGGPGFVSCTTDIASRCGAQVVPLADPRARLLVVPFIDPVEGTLAPLRELAATCHHRNIRLVADATFGLAACELRVDEWAIDVCIAGVEHTLGSPPGMTLVTYAPGVEVDMTSRKSPPRTSYLDLLQLQAYWSPERLNHHTAPTSLVYGLREALRIVQDEGLDHRWRRHRQIGQRLRTGLQALGLEVDGELPYSIVQFPRAFDEAKARRRLLEEFGVYVTRVGPGAWRLGLLGADARLEAVNLVLAALEKVLAA
jgi:aspartate aminotransferase-like enzyme